MPTVDTDNKKCWLSATGIDVLETCSFKYFAQIHNKVPQLPNIGSTRGSIIHRIFQILANKRHRKHVDQILSQHSIEASRPVQKLLIRHLIKDGIYDTLNYDIMINMLLVGLKHDFYGEERNGESSKPEFRFELESEDPKYRIRGFIDKYIKYPDGRLLIRDFKSSKSKFTSDALKGNNQALTYSLVGYKLLEAKDVKTEFLFLRFPHQPKQEVKPTREQLGGFEHYLAYLYSIIENFDEKAAKSNFAALNPKNRWLCRKGSWVCPYLSPFAYFALVNDKGEVMRTSRDKTSLKPQEGQKMVEMNYEGCPFWKDNNNDL